MLRASLIRRRLNRTTDLTLTGFDDCAPRLGRCQMHYQMYPNEPPYHFRSSDFQNSRLATPAAAYYYLRHFETSGRQLLSSRRRLRHLFERPDICAAQTGVHTLIHVEGLDSYGQWSYRVLTRIEMPRATTSAGWRRLSGWICPSKRLTA